MENQEIQNTENAVVNEVIAEVKPLGRPVNPNSARQIRLAEMEAKRQNGELKRGRPVNGSSERQKRLKQLAKKAKANGGEIKRGRPVNGQSVRQIRLAEMAARAAANGGVIKRGRPAQPKPEVVVAPEVVVENKADESAA